MTNKQAGSAVVLLAVYLSSLLLIGVGAWMLGTREFQGLGLLVPGLIVWADASVWCKKTGQQG